MKNPTFILIDPAKLKVARSAHVAASLLLNDPPSMMRCFLASVLFGLVTFSAGRGQERKFDHPADEAAARLQDAEKALQASLRRMEDAISRMPDPAQRAAALAAVARAQKAWRAHVDADHELFLKILPLPETATSVGLSSYFREADALGKRAAYLAETAKFLEKNF